MTRLNARRAPDHLSRGVYLFRWFILSYSRTVAIAGAHESHPHPSRRLSEIEFQHPTESFPARDRTCLSSLLSGRKRITRIKFNLIFSSDYARKITLPRR